MIAHVTTLGTGLVAVVLVGSACYAVAWSRRRHPVRLAVAFAVGSIAVLVADNGPVHEAAERSFTGHMVQHLVLLLVAAPAFALARPGAVVADAMPRRYGARLVRWRRPWVPMRSSVAPAVGVVLLVAIHLTPWYEAAVRHDGVHALEHVAFVAAGWCLWAPVLAPVGGRAPSRMVVAFTIVAAMGLLGMVLTTAPPISSTYVERLGHAGALADQRAGAALMWSAGILLGLPLVIGAVWRIAVTEQHVTERREQLERDLVVTQRPVPRG